MTLTYKSSHSKSQPRGSWKRGRDISMSLIISSARRASVATRGTYATATSSACITLFPHTPPLLTQQITSSSCFISNPLTVPQLLACTLVLLESKWSRLQEKSRAPGLSSVWFSAQIMRKILFTDTRALTYESQSILWESGGAFSSLLDGCSSVPPQLFPIPTGLV